MKHKPRQKKRRQQRRPPRTLSKRRWLYTVAVVLIVLVIIADRSGWLLQPAIDDVDTYHEMTVRVIRVIDGDTFDIALPDGLQGRDFTRIRLWGADCPELGQSGRPPERFAVAARDFSAQLVLNRDVVLRLEAQRTRGTFGRILAHVDLDSGTSLNRQLLLAGLAHFEDRWTHSRLLTYEQAALAARRAEAGVWADDDS